MTKPRPIQWYQLRYSFSKLGAPDKFSGFSPRHAADSLMARSLFLDSEFGGLLFRNVGALKFCCETLGLTDSGNGWKRIRLLHSVCSGQPSQGSGGDH